MPLRGAPAVDRPQPTPRAALPANRSHCPSLDPGDKRIPAASLTGQPNRDSSRTSQQARLQRRPPRLVSRLRLFDRCGNRHVDDRKMSFPPGLQVGIDGLPAHFGVLNLRSVLPCLRQGFVEVGLGPLFQFVFAASIVFRQECRYCLQVQNTLCADSDSPLALLGAAPSGVLRRCDVVRG